MNGTASSRPADLRREAGSLLLRQREARGLKRSQVAAAVGYGNLSKGARRIADWEKGCPGPLLDAAAYFAAIGVETGVVESLLRQADAVERRIGLLGCDVIKAERLLLCSHAPRLIEGLPELQRRPELGHIRSPAVSFRVLWAGGGSLGLASLAAGWSDGSLVAETEHHGPVFLFEGAGSALSGAGQCTGIDRHGDTRKVAGSPSRYIGRPGPNRHGTRDAPSPLSLADAVAALGGDVRRTHFHRLDADAHAADEPIATYDPGTRELHVRESGSTCLDDVEPLGEIASHPEWGGVSIGGCRPQPVTLAPDWDLGGFRSEALGHTCGLSLQAGSIRDQRGRFPVRVVGPSPPPGVLPLLANLLAPPR